MFGYEEYGISLSFHFVYLLFALLLSAGYTFYAYKYTIPQTGKFQKAVLTILRTLALLLLLLILFEPILNLTRIEKNTPSNFVFIDNSRSIKIDDQTNRKESTLKIVEMLSANSQAQNIVFYTFGSDVNEVSLDSLSNIKFTDGVTNIANIFSFSQKDELNLSSIILISDGVFNSGNNPYYNAVKTGVPVFTIGVGDTTRRKDIEIKKVLHNELVYAETPTTVAATIQNYGFENEKITVTLTENGKIISSNIIKLSSTGIQNVPFEYTPESSGEKKLSVDISKLNGEFTLANNKRIFYLNVLSNKIGILLIASSPSSDLSFIKNSLQLDENLAVNSITQISSNRFLEDLSYSKLDSADILFLIGFPSNNTPNELWTRVQNKIVNEKVPYFLTLSPNINLNRLMDLKSELSFTIQQSLSGYKEVQPEISTEFYNHPLIQHVSSNVVEAWNKLPPVLQPKNIFATKPESRILSIIKINNKLVSSPLIMLRNFSGRKSVTILAKDIWRWKLQTAIKQINLFESFISNSVKWLNAADNQKKVAIKTSKKNYSQGERVDFSAQVLDESLNSVSNAEIKIKIDSDDNSFETDLQMVGKGIYEGSIALNETGDFNFSGEALREGKKLGQDKGTFNIGEIDLEMIDPVMNYNLLNLIANETGGKYFSPENKNELLKQIDKINRVSIKEKVITSEIKLWSSEWMLITAILLFSIEWFIRKRVGLL
ncbi:MAG: VWA domain-containing protein [Ignavibacteria bacterium]|nr:VWA domain-containing protein [Ignavibacteria bacterium]MBT8380900.1 VWA domain-containing protein [Ignavibacteria bacterium]MBT8391021.1 VWA domain-containing protein [Ignavibacteria bacterium]NNJ54169.1 hypothetical protein [Ignavibacteriaceae bacterium]NNL20676.1 hypothetical protein [Ignavibacteriaceae bacterium]